MGVLIVLSACVPTLTDEGATLGAPRLLAVSLDPAEGAEGDEGVLRALAAGAEGPVTPEVDWAFCDARKPLAELGPVAAACLDPASDALTPLGRGAEVAYSVPDDACDRFGPNPPPASADAPAGRPVDPDVTGGYYQPLIGFGDDGSVTLTEARVRCGLANVSQETFITWNQAYRSNVAPVVTSLTAAGEVRSGDDVTLEVQWDAAESYVVYDPEADALLDRRESISVSWYTTAGVIDTARNGRGPDDERTAITNQWTAPPGPGDVWLAAVVRDDRGGVGFGSLVVAVLP